MEEIARKISSDFKDAGVHVSPDIWEMCSREDIDMNFVNFATGYLIFWRNLNFPAQKHAGLQSIYLLCPNCYIEVTPQSSICY
jgi:hypothetical protein